MTWYGLIGNALSITIFVTAMMLYIKEPPSSNERRITFWIVSPIAACALVAFMMFAGTAMLVGAKEVWLYVPKWR